MSVSRTLWLASVAAAVMAAPVLAVTAAAYAVQPLTVTTNFLPDASVGYAYSVQLTATGGTAPYTWTASGLPAGLVVSKTGAIGGTARSASVSSVTFTAVDAQTAAAKSAIIQLTTLAVPAGRTYTWGDNSYGELGNGNSPASEPVSAVPGPVFSLATMTTAAVTQDTGYGLKTDGTVVTWGANQVSQLGDGDQVSTTVPEPVLGLTSVRTVLASTNSGLALRTDGTVWAWGFNGDGQLGDGTTDYLNHSTPTQVGGLPPINVIAACYLTNYAVAKNGTVWAWGYNGSGSIGNVGVPINTIEAKPVQVTGLTGVRALACSSLDAYAVRSDGSAWAWGENNWGQLGNSSTTPSNVPVAMSTPRTVRAVAVSDEGGILLLANGTITTWGLDNFGQLGTGDPSLQQQLTPVPVPGLTSVTAISRNVFAGYALRSDGTVWSWGSNFQGELGNGTTSSAPTLVPAKVPSLAGVVAIGSVARSSGVAAIVGG